MKILHTSDQHSNLHLLEEALGEDWDVWVDTGDLLPNLQTIPSNVQAEIENQIRWVERKLAPLVAAHIRGRPAIFLPGNHDFIDVAPYLQKIGVRAHALWKDHQVSPQPLMVEGERFSGFPHVPAFGGVWSYEAMRFGRLIEGLRRAKPTILCTHAPPYGVLDHSLLHPTKWGLVDVARYQNTERTNIKLHLFGHIHQAAGTMERNGILFSNAATTWRVVEV